MTSKSTLQDIFDSAPDATLIVNDRGYIVMVNRRVEAVLGYRSLELVGQKVEVLIPVRVSATHIRNRDTFFTNPGVREMGEGQELFAVRKDKSEIDVQIRLSHITLNDQKLVIASIRDVTQHKKLANQLASAVTQLQQKNKELEQFALVVSHDLREPLRGISTFAAFLRDEHAHHLDAIASMYIQTILESTRRMEKLIISLTNYSLIGKLDIYTPVDLNTLLQDVLTDLTMVIHARQAVIVVDPLPVVETNETAMRELFQNLIVNAIKYCHKSVIPNVHVSVNDAPSHFHFSVKDNGIGIDPQHHDRIFEVFERLHTKEEYEGTGIGLAHCKKIVEMHGGRIWINSTPDKGSTFHFTIPKSSMALTGAQ